MSSNLIYERRHNHKDNKEAPAEDTMKLDILATITYLTKYLNSTL